MAESEIQIPKTDDEAALRKLAKTNVMNLGSFLDHLYELANKGLHGEISHQDANRAVIYTYLLLGDIIEFTSHD